MKRIILAALFVPCSALAQQQLPLMVYTYTSAKNILVVNDSQSRALFTMGPDGCLVGPLEITNMEGDIVFKLEKGIAYPIGCTKNGEKQ